MRRIVLTFGLIAGAIMSILMVLAMVFKDQIGFDKGVIVGYTSMVLAFLLVFFGVRSYRDTLAGERISFGRAFSAGLLIVLVASACYVATWQVVYYNFMPDYLDKYAAYALAKDSAAGATAEQLAAKSREMADFRVMYQNPLVNIAFTLLEPLPVGLVFSLVCAGILSRKRRGQAGADLAAEPTQ